MLRFVALSIVMLGAVVLRRAMPDLWMVQALLSGYRFYLFVTALAIITIIGECVVILLGTSGGPDRHQPTSVSRSTALHLDGRGSWAVWGVLLLGVILLSML